MNNLFDKPEEYEAMLHQGIALTGNDRHFFIRGRFDFMMKRGLSGLNPSQILDFGCGTGEASAELRSRFPDASVFGYDPAEKAMEYAREKHKMPGLSFIGDRQVREMKFDLIFLNCVLHHIVPEKRQETVSMLAGLLSPNGQLWIFENNPANPGTRWAMYKNPFDNGVVKIWPSSLRNMLKKAGLKERDHGFLFYFPQWLSFFRPLERFLTQLPLGGQYSFMAAIPNQKIN